MTGDTRTLKLQIQAETEVARLNIQKLASEGARDISRMNIATHTASAEFYELQAAASRAALGIARAEAEAEKAARALDRTGDRAAHASRQLRDADRSASGFAAGLVGGLLSGVATQLPAALISMTKNAVEFGASIDAVSKKAGVGTDFLQQYRFGATQTGADVGKADQALLRFSATIGKAADGNKAAAKAFKDLGVDIADSSGNLKSNEQLYREVADAIAKIGDPARQSAQAVKFFGETGVDILPFLKEGSQGFDQLAKAAGALGIVLTPEQIKNLDDLGNKAAQLKLVLTSQMAAAIGENADAIIAIGKAAGGAIGVVGRFLTSLRGADVILRAKGTMFAVTQGNSEMYTKVATPEGKNEFLRSDVADLKRRIKAVRQRGLPIGDLAAELARSEGALDESNAEMLNRLNTISPFKVAGSASGGKVIEPPENKAKAKRAAAAKKPERNSASAADVRAGLAEYDLRGNGVYRDPGSNSSDLDSSIEDSRGITMQKAVQATAASFGATGGPAALMDEFEDKLKSVRNELGLLPEEVDAFGGSLDKALDNATFEGLHSLEDGLFDIVTGAKSAGEAFGDMAKSIIASLIKIAIQQAIIQPIAGALFGGAGGLGGIFGGFFADGGVPPAGKVSVVGEDGPELIVGNGQARVVPMSKAAPSFATMGGGGGNTTIINVDARASSDPAEVDRRVQLGIAQAAPTIFAGTKAGITADARRPRMPGGRG